MKHNFKHYLQHNLDQNFERAMTASFGLTMTVLLLTTVTFYTHHAVPAIFGLCGLVSCLLVVIYLYARIEIVHGREMEQAGKESHQQTAHLLESIADAFLAIDAQGHLTYANGPAELLLGQKRADLVGCHLQDALPVSILAALMREYNDVLTSQAATRFECCDPAAQCWYEVLICPTPEGISIGLRDITPRKRVEEEQGRLLAILEATPDLIGINDMNGQICYFNRAGRLLLGLEEPHAGTKYKTACDASTISGIDLALVEEELFPMGVEHGVWQGEKTLHLGDSRTITVSQVVIPHRGPDGKVAYLSTIARDISEYRRMDAQMQQHLELICQQKAEMERHQAELVQANETVAAQYTELFEANKLLETLATTDSLTGLKNHRAFQQRLALDFERSIRYRTPLSLLLLDVDKFKQYNDTFGHPAGDEVLKKVAQILQSIARNTDIVARYGGEEFVIVLPETDDEGAAEAAERIREAIAGADWDKRIITASIGAASLRINTASPYMLIEEADKALYMSKEFGRNCVTHFDLLLNALVQVSEKSPIHRP
jgi:diguanylate cyclase (GGDEF)-like protein/PAS domain S-box-containing protein